MRGRCGSGASARYIRVTTDDPEVMGYGETILHYTWGRVSDETIEKVRAAIPRPSWATTRWAQVCRWRSTMWSARRSACRSTGCST